LGPDAADPVLPRPEPVTQEAKEELFWKYFHDKVSEWNPCFGEGEEVRFRWDEDVGAHDVEVAMGDADGSASDVAAAVRLHSFCPDVASTPHTVRLSSLLEKVLLEPDGTPRTEVDLNPVRQLVASLVNNGNRHDRHGKLAPDWKKDACARGKPECPYCRYGFPHELRSRCDGVGLQQQEREGQWKASFPRNDALVGSYEPHVLLANLGNVDWRPLLNLWAVVEYVTKYAMKSPGKSKPMKEVLRGAVDEICKYTKEGEPLDLMRKSLQKVYTKTLGGRDYGIFEAVHLGLGLPLVFPLMNVETLNTDGVRAAKSGKHLKELQPGQPAVWDSKTDKFNKRLHWLRKSFPKELSAEMREAKEVHMRDLSLYEFWSKYDVRGQRVCPRAAAVALQVTPGYSADCARVDHGLHEAYARRCVIAFWRMMPTRGRFELAKANGRSYDGRLIGSTRFDAPLVHGGFPELDRFLGVTDLYAAFESPVRRELRWEYDPDGLHDLVETSFRRKDKLRPRYGWGFALVEMLVDPVLQCWVPRWMTEQFERRNPDFRKAVEDELRADTKRVKSNREVIVAVRKVLRQCAKRLAKEAARKAGARGAAQGEGDGKADVSSVSESSAPNDGSGSGGDEKAEALAARAHWVQEPLPSGDGFDGDATERGEEWAKRSAEQRASSAGPAPTASLPAPLPPAIVLRASGVSINPPGFDWAAGNWHSGR
jgi:hypothetical protein